MDAVRRRSLGDESGSVRATFTVKEEGATRAQAATVTARLEAGARLERMTGDRSLCDVSLKSVCATGCFSGRDEPVLLQLWQSLRRKRRRKSSHRWR